MKVSVLQENLIKGLSTVARTATTKAQLPILANILLATQKGRLKLAATNLETSINFYLGAKIEKEGKITVPAKTLVELIASLSPGRINLETKGDALQISTANFQAEINGINADEFPKIPSLSKSKPSLVLTIEKFREMIDEVAYAAATDEDRPVLTGVKFSLAKGGSLTLAATDGYRLSVKKVKIGQQNLTEGSLIIPARTLQEVSRIKEEGEIRVLLMKKGNQIVFGLEDVEVVTRLLEENFPSFEKIIPQEKKTRVTVEKEGLIEAVKIAAIFARETANIVKFQIKKDSLKISANAPQLGKNEATLEAKVEGEENKIAFNFRYLLDFLHSVAASEIVFEMTGPLNPGVFKPKDDKSLLHIIMPVRVQE